jgi:2-hydroxychromene-2-carboxylate isomerase
MDNPAVYRDALLQSGLDADRILALIQTAEVKQTLMESTEGSVARGTFGSPTFFIGGEMWFGKDRLRDVEDALSAPRNGRGR